MKAYTLKEMKDTGELHLFEGEMQPDGRCSSENYSICGKMSKSESAKNVFACLDEDDARMRCAEIGRDVCGICVSHLYESYD